MLLDQTVAGKSEPCGSWPGFWAAAVAGAYLTFSLAISGFAGAQPRQKPAPAALKLPNTAPLPPSRPERPQTAERSAETPAEELTAPPVPPACLKTLGGLAIVEERPPIAGPNGCGATDAVRLQAVIGVSGERIALEPAADLRCGMAEAVVRWVREDVAPTLRENAAPLKAIGAATSYQCRPRNHVAGALLSEHGLANALDVIAMRLTDGTVLNLTDRTASKPLRERLRDSACEHFTTVLGPGSDGVHEDHIHLDVRQRRGGYRICQWDVLEPAQEVARGTAVPMPIARPPASPVEANAAARPATRPLPAVRRGREAVAHLPLAPRPVQPAVKMVSAPLPPPRPKAKTDADGAVPARTKPENARRADAPKKRSRTSKRRRSGHDPFRDFRSLFRF